MKNSILHAEFGEAQRAACYLSSGLSAAFPGTMAHVTFFTGTDSQPRSFTVDTRRLEPVLERIARRFPSHEMEVLYDPAKQSGVVGVLRCSCGHLHKKCCPRCCKANADKPQAIVRILDRQDELSSANASAQACTCNHHPVDPT